MTQTTASYLLNESETETYFDINYDHQSQQSDPFHNLGDNITEPKMFKVDSVVFAEPLDIGPNNIYEEQAGPHKLKTNEVKLTLDNVTIIKTKGKRKKYSMNIDKSNLICSQPNCGKAFMALALLKAHIRKVHCSEKDFVCEKCGAGFTARYLLNRHYAVHGGDKVQCPVCEKMLSRRTNLALHLRSHSDTRLHQCDLCQKRFLRKSTLKVHNNFVHKETI